MKRGRVTPLVVVMMLAVACSDSTSVDIPSLVGTWSATSAVLTNPAVTSQSVDIVSLGASLTITIAEDSSVTFVIDDGSVVDTESGALSVAGNDFTLVLDGETTTGTLSRTDDTLILNVVTGIRWDFGDVGFDVPVTARMVFERRRTE